MSDKHYDIKKVKTSIEKRLIFYRLHVVVFDLFLKIFSCVRRKTVITTGC